MPEIVRELTVNAPIENTWALVSDMERFSLCIPGCREVKKVSDSEFDWIMEAKVLRTTRKVTARTHTREMKPPTHAEFSGQGRLFERSNHYKLTIEGTTDLEELPDNRTRVRFAGNVKASGMGGPIIDKVASGQMEELFGEFEKNLKHALGDDAAGEADQETAAKDSARKPGRGRLYLIAAAVGVAVAALVLTALLT